MKSSKKSPEMNAWLDDFASKIFGKGRTDSILKDQCVTCANLADEFRDALSRKEFSISGMCQVCQDSVFGRHNPVYDED
jgi:hypothetical protein